MSQVPNISLSKVDEAITAALAGKSYTLPNGVSVTRQDIGSLYTLRRQIAEDLRISEVGLMERVTPGRF